MNKDSFQFNHKFTDANQNTLIKEIRKRDLIIRYKKKKFLFGEDVIDTVHLRLSDLYTQCTFTKPLKLAGQ